MLYFKIKIDEWMRQREVKKVYWKNLSFKNADKAFFKAYRFSNSYALSRRFLSLRKAENIHAYGETPIKTLDRIGKAVNLNENSIIADLGAGRGRAALFFKHFFQARVIAIEENPFFFQKSRDLDINMKNEDFFHADLSQATHLYLYGTCLKKQEIKTLCRQLNQLPKKPIIITVSYPLNLYHSGFKLLKVLKGEFPWGQTEVYINQGG